LQTIPNKGGINNKGSVTEALGILGYL